MIRSGLEACHRQRGRTALFWPSVKSLLSASGAISRISGRGRQKPRATRPCVESSDPKGTATPVSSRPGRLCLPRGFPREYRVRIHFAGQCSAAFPARGPRERVPSLQTPPGRTGRSRRDGCSAQL